MTLFDQNGAGLNSTYGRFRDSTDAGDIEHKIYLENLWKRTNPYLDSNFTSEFARNPQQRFWEMRLVAALLDQGFALEPTGEGKPDIATRLPSGDRLWIEAVAPTLGSAGNPDRPPDLIPDGKFRSVPIEKILMRYTQAIAEKRDRFRSYREAGAVNANDRCVIALNSGGLWPHVEGLGPPRILSAVFPIGPERIMIDSRTGQVLKVDHEYRGKVSRANGADVSLTAFLDPAYNQIGGIISDSARVFGWHQQGNQRFVSVNNPTTTTAPLPEGFFKLGTEYVAERDEQEFRLVRRNHQFDGFPNELAKVST